MRPPRGRAYSDIEKKEVIETLFSAWKACPLMRLGQLIDNSMSTSGGGSLFYVEDRDLEESLVAFTGLSSADDE